MICCGIALGFAVLCFIAAGTFIDKSKIGLLLAIIGGCLCLLIGMTFCYDAGRKSQTPEQQKIEYQKQIDYYQRKIDELNREN